MSELIRLFKVAMSPEAKVRVGEVLDSGYIGQGPKVDEFERALAKEFEIDDDVDGVLTTNSCTSAIDLALHLCGVGPGDEVITTAMTCTATNTMIVNRHAKIVWADVNPKTGCIDPVDVARKVTKHTKAIIAVDWAGRPCDYDGLRAARANVVVRIPIIEDAAHAYLVKINGKSIASKEGHRRVGGDFICHSYQAIKSLTTVDGGSIVTPLYEYDRAKLLRWYGLDRTKGESFRCSQVIEEAGYKYHMSDVSASIGLANIELARANVEKHRANTRFYHEALKNANAELPLADDGSSWWLYTILVDDRDGFIERMKTRGIECSPVHARNDKHPAFRGFGGPLPGLDYFASHEVAIPVGWWLSEGDLERVANSVLACVRG